MNKIEMKMLFVFVFLFFLDALKIAVLNNMRWFGARNFFWGPKKGKRIKIADIPNEQKHEQ